MPRPIYGRIGDTFAEEWELSHTAQEVIDQHSPKWIDTGLLDEWGQAILRRRDTVRLGFVPK